MEALELAKTLANLEFDGIFSSPLRRCKETLVPYLQGRSESITLLEGLIEMDYGLWSGKSLSTLSRNPMWKTIQSRPSSVRFPEGESFVEMQSRAVDAVAKAALGKKRILILSHGDVIKSIIAFHLGLALDQFQRISIDPASISRVVIPHSQVVQVNSIAHLAGIPKASGKGSVLKSKLPSRLMGPQLGGGSGEA
jgi:probable phosphoglycerate mutase